MYYSFNLLPANINRSGDGKALAGEGEEAGGGIAGVDFDGVVVAAADEKIAAVGGDVEVARVRAGGRVADVVQEAAGADFEAPRASMRSALMTCVSIRFPSA